MIDRYGNREFDAVNTTTLGSCTQAVCNPDINPANNRFSSGQGYAYDQNGNVTQDAEGKRFGYDAENHQTKFFAAGNGSNDPDATYSYDGDGRRIKKVTATETTVFVYNASGQLVAEYSTQISQTPQVSYLTTDHLGSPRVVSDQLGAVKDRKDYSAFGESTISAQRQSALGYTAAAGDELRKGYTGYEKDNESGLDFAQARYYNSTHGRYTSIDPLTASASIRNPQTFNRYSYVLNSPYKYTDPLGLLPEKKSDCDFQCRVNKAIDGKGTLSDADLELAKFHIRNGTALGYAFLNAAQAAIGRQSQSSTTTVLGASESGSTASPGQPSPQTKNCPQGARCEVSESEQFIVDNFFEPGAYVSNPNDGDPYDQSNGTMLVSPDNNDPHTHAYASTTGEGTLSVYVPKGGEVINTGTYTDRGSGKTVPFVSIFFTQLGKLKNVTVFVMHVANYSLGPVQADGRRKIGTLGSDVGGEWTFRSYDSKGSSTTRAGYHFHLELVRGRVLAPVLGKKNFINWTRVTQ